MKKLLFPFFAVLLLLAGAGSALVSCKSPTTTFNKVALERQNRYRAIDDTIIQSYLARHQYGPGSYTRTDAGLYIIKVGTNPQPGAVPTKGKQVAVKYIGQFIDRARDGTIFDSSINGQTICNCRTFTVGSTIDGWSQALMLMHQGDRILLLVPSYLAYGPQGNPGTIVTPDSPLLFDMTLVSVQ